MSIIGRSNKRNVVEIKRDVWWKVIDTIQFWEFKENELVIDWEHVWESVKYFAEWIVERGYKVKNDSRLEEETGRRKEKE